MSLAVANQMGEKQGWKEPLSVGAANETGLTCKLVRGQIACKEPSLQMAIMLTKRPQLFIHTAKACGFLFVIRLVLAGPLSRFEPTQFT